MKECKSKYWLFTDYSAKQKYDKFADGNPVYAVWHIERCPTTGKKHGQGYIEFTKRTSINTVRRMLGNHAHLEYAKSPNAANNYCQKHKIGVEGPWYHGSKHMTTSTKLVKPVKTSIIEQYKTSESDLKWLRLADELVEEGRDEDYIASNFYPLYTRFRAIIKLKLKKKLKKTQFINLFLDDIFRRDPL